MWLRPPRHPRPLPRVRCDDRHAPIFSPLSRRILRQNFEIPQSLMLAFTGLGIYWGLVSPTTEPPVRPHVSAMGRRAVSSLAPPTFSGWNVAGGLCPYRGTDMSTL